MLKHTAAALALVASAHAQGRFDSVQITSEEVAPGIYVLFGAGGNLGLHTGDEATFLIDDQFAPLTPKILAKVEQLSGGGVDFVLNTHFHGDHTGGNENLGKAGALIFGHDNVRKRVIEDNNAPGNAPVVTFNDQQAFHINGQTLRAYHVHHAHTDSDSFVKFEEANVIHTGDLMFDRAIGSFPFIDIARGGSINGAITAMEAMMALADDDTIVIPGHGQLSDKAGMAEYHAMLKDIRDKVQRQIARGRSKAEVVKSRPAKKYAEGREGGFVSEDRFIETVYDSLTAE